MQRGGGKGHQQGEHWRQVWHLVYVKLNYEKLLTNCKEANHAFFITGLKKKNLKYRIKIHQGKGREV